MQEAKSLVVDTALDVVNSFDGVTSLREAVAFINAGEASGTITFDASVFNGEAQDIIRLTQGNIASNHALSIDGDIDGDGTPDVVISGDVDGNDIVDAQGVTDIGASSAAPGNLLDDNTATLLAIVDNANASAINGLILTGGHGLSGGAGLYTLGPMTVSNSLIAGNATTFGGGGGIFSFNDLTLVNTTVSGNESAGSGGGIYSNGDVTLFGSAISGNSNSNFGGRGGGLYARGGVTAIGSTISGNRTEGGSAEGGGIFAVQDLVLVNATLAGNGTLGASSEGGGAHAFNITAVNSTVTGNYTTGANGIGGGLYAVDDLSLTNAIVLGNTTTYAGVGSDEVGFGGMLSFFGQNIVGSNFLAFNTAGLSNVVNGNPALVFKQIQANNGIFGGRLADNGGLVQTVALRDTASNPALNAGLLSAAIGLDEAALGVDLNGNGTATDLIPAIANLPQDARGPDYSRLFGPGLDLGAFELETAGPVQGTAGNDLLFGGALNDTLNGLGGNDVLNGGPGADTLNGGSGTNEASYQYAQVSVLADLVLPEKNTGEATGDSYLFIQNLTGSQYDDELWGTFAANTIRGGAGDDEIYGRAGNDMLFGQDGDDVLNGGAGADMLHGGAGVNAASYSMAGGPLVVDLVLPAKNTGEAAGDTYVWIQNLIGSNFADELWGNFAANSIWGGSGSDIIRARHGDDILYGGEGNDTLDGGPGADVLEGGNGTDWAWYLSSPAGLVIDLENPANNTGDAAGDTYVSIENIQGSSFDDMIRGDGQANLIRAGAGKDMVFGGAGDDILQGEGGDDVLDGGPGADALLGGGGIDTVSYSSAAAGVVADLVLPAQNTGDAAGDSYSSIEIVRGSSHDDVLRGTFGQNRLEGGGGDDILQGRGGGDTYNGGVGDDTFVFQNGFALEVIEDFNEFSSGEKIDLSAVTNITDFADLAANHLTQNGLHADITDGAGTIRLLNVQIANLDSGDFIF